MVPEAKQKEIIEDEGPQVFRSALEAVQFADKDWKTISKAAAEWGYGAIQLTNFHLPPKDLVEKPGLAEEVKKTLTLIEGGDGRGPMQLAGYSTHCALETWGFPQHPGVGNFIPADDETLVKLLGQPEEIRKWMWDNVVQYIPEATAKLGLMGTHTFIPPAVIGDIEGLEHAGALVASYPFVPCHEVKVVRDGEIKTANLWEEAVQRQAARLEPFFDKCIEHNIWLGHEMHYDTMARGITEYLQVLEMMGEKAKQVFYLGIDGSHAWQGESARQWVREGGNRIRNVHIKNLYRQYGLPIITGDAKWIRRGMHFGAADEGPIAIGQFINDLVAHSDFVNQPTYKDDKPIGQIDGKDVYLKFVIGEGEHPLMTQIAVAKEYARVLNQVCQRRYGAGFKVGGAKG